MQSLLDPFRSRFQNQEFVGVLNVRSWEGGTRPLFVDEHDNFPLMGGFRSLMQGAVIYKRL